jgi:hypothetical protein
VLGNSIFGESIEVDQTGHYCWRYAFSMKKPRGLQGALMWRTVIAAMVLLLVPLTAYPQSSWSDILDLNDQDAAALLHAMGQKGDLTTKEFAEAWIVISFGCPGRRS